MEVNAEFEKRHDEVLAAIPKYDSHASRDKLEDHFNQVNTLLVDLQAWVANYAVISVNSYYAGSIKVKLEKLYKFNDDERAKAMPKKAFRFTRKPKAVLKKEQEAKSQVSASSIDMTKNDLVLKNVYFQTIRKEVHEYEGKENVIIEGLENCEVFLPFSVKSVYVKNLTDCKVYIGAIQNALFVNSAKQCEFHASSHQIRIHNSEETSFFLIAKSNPIIEHCSRMKFGPNKTVFDKQQDILGAVGLKDIKNMFDQVLDFNWHRQDKSPNWEKVEGGSELKIDQVMQ